MLYIIIYYKIFYLFNKPSAPEPLELFERDLDRLLDFDLLLDLDLECLEPDLKKLS